MFGRELFGSHSGTQAALVAFAALVGLLLVLIWLWPDLFTIGNGAGEVVNTEQVIRDEMRKQIAVEPAVVEPELKEEIRAQMQKSTEQTQEQPAQLSEDDKAKIRAQMQGR